MIRIVPETSSGSHCVRLLATCESDAALLSKIFNVIEAHLPHAQIEASLVKTAGAAYFDLYLRELE
jgi:hypothetical protein